MRTTAARLTAALEALDARVEKTLAELCELARIPGVSAEGFDARELERSAVAVAVQMRAAGLEHVEILRLPGAHPYVVGDWLHAGASAPTVLIYAHHDVQPPGRPEKWLSPAFEPTLRADGRLYGRGVVDDKAGLLVHLAALRACFEAGETPPVNVKLLVEGEEEIGSPHLEAFLRAHRARLTADVIVLSDTANLDAAFLAHDQPARAGRHGACVSTPSTAAWGRPVADSAGALVRLLARLVDDRGVIQIPGSTTTCAGAQPTGARGSRGCRSTSGPFASRLA
jgi:acetylornithine deacetylase/succinyl-diaminopimelate desuccinylase-like protein